MKSNVSGLSQDFLGLMNCLMQLKKVCNHPDLFEPRSTESATLLKPLLLFLPCLLHFTLKNTNILHSNLAQNELDYSKLEVQTMQALQFRLAHF